jgi:hypothetical protein
MKNEEAKEKEARSKSDEGFRLHGFTPTVRAALQERKKS